MVRVIMRSSDVDEPYTVDLDIPAGQDVMLTYRQAKQMLKWWAQPERRNWMMPHEGDITIVLVEVDRHVGVPDMWRWERVPGEQELWRLADFPHNGFSWSIVPPPKTYEPGDWDLGFSEDSCHDAWYIELELHGDAEAGESGPLEAVLALSDVEAEELAKALTDKIQLGRETFR